MKRHHAFASSDGDGRNETPKWAENTTCQADEGEQRAQKAMIAKLSADEAKQQARTYDQNRVHQQEH